MYRRLSKDELNEAQKHHIQDERNKLYGAASRLSLETSGRAHDIFAADVLYHKTCYYKFIPFE